MPSRTHPIDPSLLDQQLPQKPWGVDAWGFVLASGSPAAMTVSEFGYPPSVYLREPVSLHVQMSIDVDKEAEAEHASMLAIEDVDDNFLCSARWTRRAEGTWEASFHNSNQQKIGFARGSASATTSASILESVLMALVRHSVASYE